MEICIVSVVAAKVSRIVGNQRGSQGEHVIGTGQGTWYRDCMYGPKNQNGFGVQYTIIM